MILPALSVLTAGVLGLACVLALARVWRQRAQRSRLVFASLLALQPALATTLYFGLFPPLHTAQAGSSMVVLTAGWRSAAAADLSGQRIALPEAESAVSAERAPDLATALRRHPQITSLHILGHGLEARDRDAARGYRIDFTPAPLPIGVVALHVPSRVATGNALRMRGRVQGVDAGTVELLDPGNQRVQRSPLARDGRFEMQMAVREAGLTTYTLRVLDAAGTLQDSVPVPMEVVTATPLRLLVLAGAPNPELKYLRRWAKDAGIAMHTRIEVGGGNVLGDAPIVLTDDSLRAFDAVLLDTRSLHGLRASEVQALTLAVHKGLGALLQLDAAPSPALRARLRGWGFVLAAGDATQTISLANGLPALSAYAVTDSANGSTRLLSDARGQPLGLWRALGRGRVGLLPIPETYPLVLQGMGERHAQLWSEITATLARSQEAAPPSAPSAPVWVGERVIVCGLPEIAAAATLAPQHSDPTAATGRCIAEWPQRAGWQQLQQSARPLHYFALPARAAPAWRLGLRQQATRQLALQSTPATTRVVQTMQQRGRAWPWLATWLALAAVVWICERRLHARPDAMR
ncbi:MAG TPA: hypothetical protein PL007_01225 [Thermomonas sp.]|jgi:hypothetical protein|nr:hypothetical protein [Thermomonas sp.]HQY48970.1 hypothetical protein [Thermomonas sp.]HRA55881.1 hypothetical protein [Thermomonas sp.]